MNHAYEMEEHIVGHVYKEDLRNCIGCPKLIVSKDLIDVILHRTGELTLSGCQGPVRVMHDIFIDKGTTVEGYRPVVSKHCREDDYVKELEARKSPLEELALIIDEC